MHTRRIAGLLLAGVLALAAPRGSAQPDAYQDAIGKALQEFELGHWTEAKVFFAQAHAIRPSARTLRGLGLTCYESRNYVEAIDYLQRALASTVQPLTPQMRAAAQKLIDESRQFVMHVRIELEPAHAELRVDGVPLALAADGGALLDPGEHELSATAPGYAELQRRVNTEGGSQLSLHLALQPLPRAPVAALHREPQPEQAEAEQESIGPWLLVGGSGALAAAGGVLLGLGLADKAAVEDANDADAWQDSRSAYERSVPFQTAGGIMLGVGLAGVAAGLAWQLWPQSESPGVALELSPFGMRAHSVF
ncbi:MAG TPA: hypothetical protein VJR89_39805 [Polyangiales bacterium]|nr:hypothetical protein [Polyangiales bacterium]